MAQKNIEINAYDTQISDYNQLFPKSNASIIEYNNVNSGLAATNVQDAIDEVLGNTSETLIVNVSAGATTSVDGSVITVTDNTVTADTFVYTLNSGETSHTFFVNTGHNVTVSMSPKYGFDTPNTVTFTAVNGYVRTVPMNYVYHNNWGYRITKSEANPSTRVTYLNDCSAFTPASMNYGTSTWQWGSWQPFVEEFFRPCMLNYDGTVAYYLDRNNQALKEDGTPSDISNMNFAGNAMVEVKKLYTYEYEDSTYSYHLISNAQLTANYVAYPFTNGVSVVQDKVYFPMFEGSLDSLGRMRSIADQVISVSLNGQQEIDAVNKNGSGYYTDYWSEHNLMAILHTLIGKSTNSQAVFGNGVVNAPAKINTGTLKTAGAFDGKNDVVSAVKTFYMENSWGNIWKRCAGIVTDANVNVLVKMIPDYNSTGIGYTNLGKAPSNGWIKNIDASNNGYEVVDTSGSGGTYFCDYFYQGANCYGIVSGSWGFGSLCGCFLLNVGSAFSFSSADIGCRPFFINP